MQKKGHVTWNITSCEGHVRKSLYQDSEYEIQAILDKRTHYRKIQYLIYWKEYPVYDATWKPLDNLKNARDAIAKFEELWHSGN